MPNQILARKEELLDKKTREKIIILKKKILKI